MASAPFLLSSSAGDIRNGEEWMTSIQEQNPATNFDTARNKSAPRLSNFARAMRAIACPDQTKGIV